eukprot:COSAG05_NODE_17088_length_332_cov_0.716738_1_plen_95_part_01
MRSDTSLLVRSPCGKARVTTAGVATSTAARPVLVEETTDVTGLMLDKIIRSVRFSAVALPRRHAWSLVTVVVRTAPTQLHSSVTEAALERIGLDA